MMLIRSFSEMSSGRQSVDAIFVSSLFASQILVSGLETSVTGTSNWRATEGMICISPRAPRREMMSGLKRDSW